MGSIVFIGESSKLWRRYPKVSLWLHSRGAVEHIVTYSRHQAVDVGPNFGMHHVFSVGRRLHGRFLWDWAQTTPETNIRTLRRRVVVVLTPEGRVWIWSA